MRCPGYSTRTGIADETAIITLAGRVAEILPALLILAAVMSRFSAAVADTVGAGGLFTELSGSRLSSRLGYIGLVAVAILLVWIGNVFDIVTLASRVFAEYYLLQCLVAIAATFRTARVTGMRRTALITSFAVMAVILALIVVFAIPVG